MIALRVIFLVIHIISAGLWISEEFASVIIARLMRSQRGKPSELAFGRVNLALNSTFGPIAGMGILITGLGLTAVDGYSILGIGGYTPTWLFVKQLVYIGLMVFVTVYLQPTGKRLKESFESATEGGIASDETRALAHRIWMLGRIHTLLVLVNIILAVWKPTI